MKSSVGRQGRPFSPGILANQRHGFLHQSASTHDQALTVDIRGGSRDGSIEENWANGDLSLHESVIPAMYPAACMICLARFQDPVMRADPL